MTQEVAVVDVTGDTAEAAKQLVDAMSTLGFVFIEGSGFTQKEVDDAFALSREFFDLPLADKEKIPITENNYGYSRSNLEVLDPQNQPKGDPKEAFNFSQFVDGKPLHELPDFFNANIEKVQHIEQRCHQLCMRLLRLMAVGLELEPEWFASRHSCDKKTGSVLRFLHYHGQKKADPEEQIRAGAHTDYGSVTLLFQKEGEDGLEILSPVSRQWTPVKFVPIKHEGMCAPIVVNCADLLSFWTAGVLRSSIHRVKFPAEAQISGKDRYSIVYFCHPQEDVPLEPVPSPIVQKVEGRGANEVGKPVITAQEHLNKRLAATYGWKKN
jgi:isopenicillin N synthase-like dioxygenase